MAPCVSNFADSKVNHFPTWAILIICGGCLIVVVAILGVRFCCKYPPRRQLLLRASSSTEKPLDRMNNWSPMDERYKPKPLMARCQNGMKIPAVTRSSKNCFTCGPILI